MDELTNTKKLGFVYKPVRESTINPRINRIRFCNIYVSHLEAQGNKLFIFVQQSLFVWLCEYHFV